jgi:hypothetical protein
MDNNGSLTFSSNTPSSTRRPLGVTILILVVLIFTSLNTLRLVTVIRTRDFLLDASLDVPVMYLLITGMFWTGFGLPLLYGLWTRRNWIPTTIMAAVVLYCCYYWFDRLLMAESSVIENRWPFALALTILTLSLTILTLTHAKAKEFFTK